VKLEPLKKWVIGRIAITRVSSTILAPDISKGVTKFVLLDEVSPEAAAEGYAPGDLVIAKTMHNIFLKGGAYHRVTFPIDEAVCKAHDVELSEFVGSDGKPLTETAEAAA